MIENSKVIQWQSFQGKSLNISAKRNDEMLR